MLSPQFPGKKFDYDRMAAVSSARKIMLQEQTLEMGSTFTNGVVFYITLRYS
jgi:hypothetical protein